MTVAELKEILEKVPDDATVLAHVYDEKDFTEQELQVCSIAHEHVYSNEGEENDSDFVFLNC